MKKAEDSASCSHAGTDAVSPLAKDSSMGQPVGNGDKHDSAAVLARMTEGTGIARSPSKENAAFKAKNSQASYLSQDASASMISTRFRRAFQDVTQINKVTSSRSVGLRSAKHPDEKEAVLQDKVNKIKAESVRYFTTDTPWLAEDGETLLWSFTRICVARLIKQQQFEAFMGTMILLNLALIWYEADYEAQCFPEYRHSREACPFLAEDVPWLNFFNHFLLSLYTVECMARLYVEREAFPFNKWNMLDLFVVLGGWFATIGSKVVSFDVAFLRTFRVLRLFRALRIILSIRELYLLVNGLADSMRAICFGAVMLFVLLAMWSIVVVEFVHPINSSLSYKDCERCPRAYRSVMSSVLTLFQIVVCSDSWGATSVPVVEEQPWTVVLLALIVVSVSLGMLNLILVVIVERASDARSRDLEHKSKQALIDRAHQKLNLLNICAEIDVNHDQKLSFDEISGAFANSAPFRDLMNLMDIREEELDQIFKILDSDGSGDVTYEEFVEELYALKASNVNIMLALIRNSIVDLRTELKGLALNSREQTKELGEMRRSTRLSYSGSFADRGSQPMQRSSPVRDSMSSVQSLQSQRDSVCSAKMPDVACSSIRESSIQFPSMDLSADIHRMILCCRESAMLQEAFADQMQDVLTKIDCDTNPRSLCTIPRKRDTSNHGIASSLCSGMKIGADIRDEAIASSFDWLPREVQHLGENVSNSRVMPRYGGSAVDGTWIPPLPLAILGVDHRVPKDGEHRADGTWIPYKKADSIERILQADSNTGGPLWIIPLERRPCSVSSRHEPTSPEVVQMEY